MGDAFDRRERPTEPDLGTFPCPGCTDERGIPQGEVLVTVWSSENTYTTAPQKCSVCAGMKEISRERLAWYRAQPPR